MMLNKIKINSLIFLVLFISPHIVYSVIHKNVVSIYYFLLLFCYFILIVNYFNWFKEKKFLKPLLFSFSFFLFGLINLVIHSSTTFFNLIAPIITFFGFSFVMNKKIDLRIFDLFLILMYVFFYFVYFSVIPDFFFRPGFDEDAVVFDNSSSNAIPMALNITLYAYMIMNRFYQGSNNKKILVFSIINLILAVIQQSRAGLIIAIVLFFISLFNYDKKKIKIVVIGFSIILVSLSLKYYTEIIGYIDLIGNINGLDALKEDNRGEAQESFFYNMNLFRFFFGYEPSFIFSLYGIDNLKYTYNVFLDIWNRYGFFQFIIFMGVILLRVIRNSKFYFPLYFFIPFFMYSIVESIFFPNFWDTIIYVLLFTTKKNIPDFIPKNIPVILSE